MTNFARIVPDGDTRERMSCRDCGYVAYENPKIVVGAVVADGDRILMCRRAIEPRRGFWTLPAGYLELGETLAEGAAREAEEETEARIEIEGVLAVYSLARIGQVQVIHRAGFLPGFGPVFGCGAESLAVELFAYDDIPWNELAFPSVAWALRAWHAGRHAPLGVPDTNPTADPRGVIPPEDAMRAAPPTRSEAIR